MSQIANTVPSQGKLPLRSPPSPQVAAGAAFPFADKSGETAASVGLTTDIPGKDLAPPNNSQASQVAS